MQIVASQSVADQRMQEGLNEIKEHISALFSQQTSAKGSTSKDSKSCPTGLDLVFLLSVFKEAPEEKQEEAS